MTKHIPNLFTLTNLSLGFWAVIMTLQGNLTIAIGLMIGGLACDFLDGTAARLLNAKSDIGQQLDSLADLVTFGVLPGALMYQLVGESGHSEIAPLATLIPALAAWRLAKFNLGGQENTFSGLPTPAYAIWTAAFVIAYPGLWDGIWILLAWLVITPWLMVAPIPMISLKFQGLAWSPNWHRYMVLTCALLALVTLQWIGIVIFIPLYILLSIYVYERKPKS